jgi:hypothetical protein
MTFDLRLNPEGELIDLNKDWRKYLLAAQSASIGTKRKS